MSKYAQKIINAPYISAYKAHIYANFEIAYLCIFGFAYLCAFCAYLSFVHMVYLHICAYFVFAYCSVFILINGNGIQFYGRTGYRWSQAFILPVAPLWCGLGCRSRTDASVVIKAAAKTRLYGETAAGLNVRLNLLAKHLLARPGAPWLSALPVPRTWNRVPVSRPAAQVEFLILVFILL